MILRSRGIPLERFFHDPYSLTRASLQAYFEQVNPQQERPTFKKTLGIILMCAIGGFAVLVTLILALQVILSLIAAE